MLTGWGTMLNQKGESMSQVDAILSKPPRIEDLNETISKVVASISHDRPEPGPLRVLGS
jgi:hypothetical protein